MFVNRFLCRFNSALWRSALVYIAAACMSAGLVFLVQPIFARMATPLLGGSAGVWNVSLVCFQAALLLGYVYAHVLTRFLPSLKAQIAVHAGLVVLAGSVLPFRLSSVPSPADLEQPALWLIGVFGVSIAPPFAMISATAPLIQSWYSRSGRTDAASPYYLYAASNAGSLVGLASYPLVIEPLITLPAQVLVWTAGYWSLAVLLVLSGLSSLFSGRGMAGVPDVKPEPVAGREPPVQQASWRQRLRWVLLAFIPSSLLIGVTTHISTDVASAPFLWVLPLMLYIATFTIVFARRPVVTPDVAFRFLPVVIAGAMLDLPSVCGLPLLLSFLLHLVALFMAALACHGLLARERPPAVRLTEFYLLMSLGGVLGGAFNALFAPVLFDSIIEYPVFLILVLLMVPGPDTGRRIIQSGGVLLALIAALVVLTMHISGYKQVLDGPGAFVILLSFPVLGIVMARGHRFFPAIAAACAWFVGTLINPDAGASTERGFFGVIRILDKDNHRLLMHGTTLHGGQYITGKDHLRPTTYYAPETPIGEIFSAHAKPGRVGVIGLGTGSVACYARPDQHYTFYEIDPLVARISQNRDNFTYLSLCAPSADIVLGDARLTMAAETEATFDLILVDAFSSDSVPVHLITREAVSLYLSRLKTNGILVMHISNRHMRLDDVLARIVDDSGIAARYKFYRPGDGGDDAFRVHASHVAVLAHSQAALAGFDSSEGWIERKSDGKRPWTDNYSNIAGAIWKKVGVKND